MSKISKLELCKALCFLAISYSVHTPYLFHHTKDRIKSRPFIHLLDKNFLVESGIVHQVYSIIDKGHVKIIAKIHTSEHLNGGGIGYTAYDFEILL